MTRTVTTFNEYHAGDTLISLHLIRALAKQNPGVHFVHFGHAHILPECSPVVEDLRNVDLLSFDSDQWPQMRDGAVNCWKNFQDQWVNSPNRWSWSAHALEHHAWTAKRIGFESPFTRREDLLFDYPALNPNGVGGSYFYDFLFVNSEPCSGQFKPMAEHGSGYLDDFIKAVARKWSVITTNPVFGVECTKDSNKTLTDIGRMSLLCRNHVMIATGPMWPCLNTTNHHFSAGRKRIAMLDNGENLNLPNIQQIGSREELVEIARRESWI